MDAWRAFGVITVCAFGAIACSDDDAAGGAAGSSGSGASAGSGGGAGAAGSAGTSGSGGSSASGGSGGLPRIGADDIVYTGSFELPHDDGSGTTEGAITYGGNALGYRADTGSLFIGGHDWYQRLGEIGIPADFSETAPILQPLVDVTEGSLDAIDDGTVKLTGSFVYGGRLIVAASSYYDADANQSASHFVSGLDLSASGDVSGPFALAGVANTRSKAGYMTVIPEQWRAAFGGPALTGNCCQSIISASSAGPSVSVFDPDALGSADPVPATTLLFYALDNPVSGDGTAQNPVFVQSDAVVGVAFPPGSSSVLFIGVHGKGEYCYGPGTSDASLHGTPDGEGNVWCHDPISSSKGTHAYPYVHQIWAYDANDLVAVKNGEKDPALEPYATFELDAIDANGGARAAGATYDPETGRLFFAESYGEAPRVHVFVIKAP